MKFMLVICALALLLCSVSTLGEPLKNNDVTILSPEKSPESLKEVEREGRQNGSGGGRNGGRRGGDRRLLLPGKYESKEISYFNIKFVLVICALALLLCSVSTLGEPLKKNDVTTLSPEKAAESLKEVEREWRQNGSGGGRNGGRRGGDRRRDHGRHHHDDRRHHGDRRRNGGGRRGGNN
ncbi:unnamed protein product [Allacma fusca]|uniref:Glycine-rich protein n=1 Tax=Allacma fusca TaxID=39272 RepID=A0A8J2J1L5_9HEXA|nr:unnamed protein product [Allacma fusca]